MMRAMGELRCAHARLQDALLALRAASEPAARRQKAETSLQQLRTLVPLISVVMRHLFATVRTRGELGSVANWQQHVLPRVFEAPAREIASALGHGLGAEAQLPRRYEGDTRLIVPTLRTSLERGEPLRLEALVLGESESVQLVWRPLGSGAWTSVPFERVDRGVLQVTLPPSTEDLEYVVQAVTDRGLLSVPAAGTEVPHTVVLMP